MKIENNISGDFLSPMFDGIIKHYDAINHVFTFGMDKRWRRKLVDKCLSVKPRKFLDLGCGTGDLAINMALLSPENTHITACDFSKEMLGIAKKKAGRHGVVKKISFVYSDASEMPFPDNYFDCAGISFAFRNMIYKNPSAKKNLAGIYRVIKQGGSCFIAESGQPVGKTIRKLHHFYIRAFVYPAGALISGNREAYKYLSESAINFFAPAEIINIFLETGFRKVNYFPLFFGAAGIFHVIK